MLKKVIGIFENLVSPLEGVGSTLEGFGEVLSKSARQIKNVVKNFSKILKGFSKVLNSFAFSIKVKALKDVAIAIGILLAAVALLTFVDQGKLWSAVGALVVISAVLVGVMIAVDKLIRPLMLWIL